MSVKNIIIRDASANDIADLTILINHLGYPTSIGEMQTRFDTIAAHPDYKTIVAVADGEMVGMAGLCKGLFYELNGPYMRILAFVVKQGSRQQGVGKILIKACEAWALEQGLHTIFVNSGNRDERAGAHAFYKQMGYAHKSSGYAKKL